MPLSTAKERASAILGITHHRPWSLPQGPWSLMMCWTDLLFAHWPIPAREIERLLPGGLELDTWDGTAWVGIVPFRMEDVKLRGLPMIPGARVFPEANVRTYVREPKSGDSGVYFFSLDASNLLAVIAARTWFDLPYFFARMSIEREGDAPGSFCRYRSRRLFSKRPAELRAVYRGGGEACRLSPSKPGTIEYFLTERYALFTHGKAGLIRGDIHHHPWPLEPAEAHFDQLTLADRSGIVLPSQAPLLHFSRSQDVLAWPPLPV